ncbi:MAG: hypothetical protein ACPL68_04975, partial [Candidatus Hydrothermia bacterium]
KAIAKKTYWFQLIRFRDPVITLLIAIAMISVAIRRFRLPREERMAWASGAFGIILIGLGISRTPDYYFVYLLVPAAVACGLGLRKLRRGYGLVVFGLVGLAGLGKALLNARALPRSQPPANITELRGHIPDDAGVIGPANLWYILYDKRLIVPLFGDLTRDKNEFLARLDSLSPGFVILTDRDSSGWMWELASEGNPVCRMPFSGYIINTKTRCPEPVREIALYRLKPAESGAGRNKAGDR